MFDLVAPADSTVLVVEGMATNEATIQWDSVMMTKTGGANTYTWLANATADFSSPALSIPADNSGLDNMLTLDFGTLDNVLADYPRPQYR